MDNATHAVAAGPRRGTRLLQRAGIIGFLFFLIKGLAWVAAPFLFVWLGNTF
jgi:hypothetical protein